EASAGPNSLLAAPPTAYQHPFRPKKVLTARVKHLPKRAMIRTKLELERLGVRNVGLLQMSQLFCAQIQLQRRNRIVKVVHLARAHNRCGHGWLLSDPRQRHLSPRDTTLGSDLGHPLDDGTIRFPSRGIEMLANLI